MMRDITAHLQRAVDQRASWGPREVRRALRTVIDSREEAGTADWDEEAGEDWARVVDDNGVVALVAARLPLVIVRSPGVAAAAFGHPEPEVVEVERTDTSLLRADHEALWTAFPEIERALNDNQTEFAPGGFAPDDLWSLTV